MEAQPLTGTTDGHRIEVCAFQKNVCCLGTNLRIATTHNACKGNRALTVTDHQVCSQQGANLTIECCEFSPLLCSTHHDPPFTQEIEVECVQWLAQFHHDKVRHINDVVN